MKTTQQINTKSLVIKKLNIILNRKKLIQDKRKYIYTISMTDNGIGLTNTLLNNFFYCRVVIIEIQSNDGVQSPFHQECHAEIFR